MKSRTTFKYQLPIEEVPKSTNQAKHDFQPIIIEEVFYHKSQLLATNTAPSKAPSIMTPEIAYAGNNIVKLNKRSNLTSFLSASQSTQLGGYPKLTPQNKVMIKIEENKESSRNNLTQSKIQGNSKIIGRVDSDESCDFFSDNLSETAAGALPENTNSQSQKPADSKSSKRQYHLFVFVHGFQASSLDMRQFRNHLQILLPKAMFLVSQANERDTDSRIEELGVKLAQEVKDYIINYCSGFHLIE